MSESTSCVSIPWLAGLHDWPRSALESLRREPVVVRVLMAQVRGSAPREPGVTMLVEPQRVRGTIGGGRLEWQALAAARALLAEREACARVQRLVLGADLGQCCGGVVELWIERLTPLDRPWLEAALHASATGPALLRSTLGPGGLQRELIRAASSGSSGLDLHASRMLLAQQPPPPLLQRAASGQFALLERLDQRLPSLWLYGAGYVGQALARIVADLPLRLTWIDARPEIFPSSLSAAVQLIADDPVMSVARAPAGGCFLVMTHSHALDYALVRALLERDDFAWLGLIGSQSKAARFRSRLRRDGVRSERIERLVCPIGIGGITSKWPAAIAVSVAAQLLQQLSMRNETVSSTPAGRAAVDCSGDCGHCQTGAAAGVAAGAAVAQ